jgi:hypothetical protein
MQPIEILPLGERYLDHIIRREQTEFGATVAELTSPTFYAMLDGLAAMIRQTAKKHRLSLTEQDRLGVQLYDRTLVPNNLSEAQQALLAQVVICEFVRRRLH